MVQVKPGDEILKKPAVARMLGVGEDTLESMVRRGEFAQPLRLTQGKRPRIGWLKSTCQAHLDKLARQAEQRPPARNSRAAVPIEQTDHFELRYEAPDRAEYAVRRLTRFGFVCEVRALPDGGATCAVRTVGSVAATSHDLRCCVPDMLGRLVLVDAAAPVNDKALAPGSSLEACLPEPPQPASDDSWIG